MTQHTTFHKATIKPGWSVTIDQLRDIAYIEMPDPSKGTSTGTVTIDFVRRKYNGGHGVSPVLASASTYSGAGWKKKIVEDACDWLERAMA